MPKLKSNRGTAKRFKLTGSGKVRRRKAFKNHILTKKSANRKRNLGQPGLVSEADRGRIKRLLPYG